MLDKNQHSDLIDAITSGPNWKNIALHIAKRYPEEFLEAFKRCSCYEEVYDLIDAGKKIEAIKMYREKTGVGLEEAKSAVEKMDSRTVIANTKPQGE